MARYARALSTLFFFLALCLSSLLFFLFGVAPLEGLIDLIRLGFLSSNGLIATIGEAVPLIIIAAGLSVPFTARVWNIGAQGQFVMGSILATWIGLELSNFLPPIIVVIFALLSAFLGGAAWIIPPILMRIYRGTNEIIATLMMNFVAVFLLYYLLRGPMEGAVGVSTHEPMSDLLPSTVMLPSLVHGANLGVGLIIALLVAFGLFLLLRYTRLGYELRIIGQSAEAARYAGISIERDVLLASILSGGIAGIAGMVEVYGATRVLLPQIFSDITTSYGYVGIPVALIASLNPMAIVLSAIFFSGIITGAYGMQLELGIPIDVVTSVYGIIMFLAPLGFYVSFARRKISKVRDR